MKSLIFVLGIALSGLSSIAQNLHKGNLIGLHVSTAGLKQGVTIGQFTTFFTSQVSPAYAKAFPGLSVYLVQSPRGQDSSKIGFIYLFNSEADRNRYFGKDGQPTAAFRKGQTQIDAVSKQLDKYMASPNEPDRYTDWVVK